MKMNSIVFRVVANYGAKDNLIWEFEDLQEAKNKLEGIEQDGFCTSVKIYKVETIITEYIEEEK